MSNRLQYDPLLVRHLAGELNKRLRGRACGAIPLFGADRSVLLPLDRGEALRLDLHPTRGWIRLVPWTGDSAPILNAVCAEIAAPSDERRIRIALSAGERFRSLHREIVIELHTNQWNAVVTNGEERRIVSVLRAREAGGRVLRPDAFYQPPAPRPRIGGGSSVRGEAREAWMEILGNVAPDARAQELTRRFAWTGRLTALPLLDEAAERADPDALNAAFERWWAMRNIEHATPVLLDLPSGPHPYPIPLPGLPSMPIPSLLDGMKRAADEEAPAARATEADNRIESARERLNAAERKVERISAQLDRADDADRLRGYGDLLLARLHEVPRGASSVTLTGWDGEVVEIPLDPALPPSGNANRWYAKARQRTRAAERLPTLLRNAEKQAERWRGAVEAGARGEWAGWVVRALERGASRGGGASKGESEPGLPYRQYRTSGGLEVRVGRSSKGNDQLTFHHSAPNDIWLHARSVPGSHVILRWPDADGSPPARDLTEAAGLAALFSKARSSGTVAVDWARRKHVRKPRGAPPGAVIPQRVKTVFVEPDTELGRRLREEEDLRTD